MSDSYQITLGIGTPASIPRFVLFGLATSISGLINASLYPRPISVNLPDREFGSSSLYDRDVTVTVEDR